MYVRLIQIACIYIVTKRVENSYSPTTCWKCGRDNHFAAQCLARNETDADKTNDEAVIAHMEVAGKIVQFQVDPGASVNILSREMS